MAIPSKAIGAGHANAATKVFKVTFSEALSTAPKIESWDNSLTYPAKDAAGATVAKEIFTGTTGNTSYPMAAAWSGGAEALPTAPVANWHPATPTAGSANPNLLKGTTNFVTCTNVPGAAGNTLFNISLRVPSDATVPSTTSMNALVQIRYTYTGVVPVLAFLYNDGGTEAAPVWLAFTVGTHGIRFCNTGTVAGTYKLTLPATGQVYAGEVWVTA